MQPPFCLRSLYIEKGTAAGSLPYYNHHPPPATADTQTLIPTQKSHTLITANDCSALARATTPALKLVELPHLGNKKRERRSLCLWVQQLKRSMEEGDVKKGISREYNWWPRCVFVRPQRNKYTVISALISWWNVLIQFIFAVSIEIFTFPFSCAP